jgi:hypothetical protein
MEITKAIKTMIVNRDAKHIDVSERLGYTKQGFSNLLKKDNYKLDDIIKIAKILDYDVKITFCDNSGNNDIVLTSKDA